MKHYYQHFQLFLALTESDMYLARPFFVLFSSFVAKRSVCSHSAQAFPLACSQLKSCVAF